MARNAEKFAKLLTQAIYRIKTNTGQPIQVIQDELEYALGREPVGSFINWLRRGHIPSNLEDIENLARELFYRGGFDEQKTCEQFLSSAGFQNPRELIDDWVEPAGKKVASTISKQNLKPFVVGPPISEPRQFFGRERELQRIFDRWKGFPLEHLALIGSRRSGKTSLLRYVAQITKTQASDLRPGQRSDWLPDRENYRWISVDFQDPRMRKLNGLLRHLLVALELPAPDPCNLETFMDLMTDHDWQKFTIILMDELGAGVVAPEFDQAFWQALRSLVNTVATGYLAFLVAAEDHPAKLANEQGKTSPFFNMFNSLELGPFTEPEARELIGNSPLPFDPGDIDWILEHSHLWPSLLQILGEERLTTLRKGIVGDSWKEEGLRRIAPYRYLWESNG